MNNTRVQKRKNNVSEVKSEPPKKALKKNEILAEYKNLREKFEILQKEHELLLENQKTNVEAICLLEETVIILENSLASSSVKTNPINLLENKKIGSQDIGYGTDSEDIIFCYECDFPADDYHDLGEHMVELHSEKCKTCGERFDTKETLEEHVLGHMEERHEQNMTSVISKLKCNFCEQTFCERRKLMTHKKQVHSEKVAICRDFAAGTCNFGDKNCWFNHSLKEAIPQAETFSCRSCEKTFDCHSDCLRHRKQEHINLVPLCKNYSNNTCTFGSNICWFKHYDMKKTQQ